VTSAELIVLLVRIATTLGVIVVACTVIFVLFRRRSDNARQRGFFRGSCRDCGYNPDTGTRTCPECAGAVLDLRLFRPLNTVVPGAPGQPDETAEPPKPDLVDHR
jgi:hypothetical protein